MVSDKEFTLRKVKIEDLEILFDWANDSLVRTNSFSTKSITISEHKAWFQEKFLTCPFWYIFELNFQPVGVIRFDEVNSSKIFLLNYLLKPEVRGKGFGKKIIEMGIYEIKKSIQKSTKVFGVVKNENIASRKTFLALGFKETIYDQISYSYEIILK
ncbi:GNAT family N-acetyltransferase [Leptospira interrogans]|uniref:FR47-like protein n=9 Tax=Leptospira interrogans TaxID=173 RepID=A0A0E2DLS1_LEPIR|nr:MULTISPECIES: GNAT family N-acetyltransferase [Leptospira]EMF40954.1 FR47-like protein [Leptospira interrogans serovar Lora str. TE 1992]EMF70854.1 FR47-like protein [Leptospira interrogans serovar Canicola str. LT1962]EMY07121.1 FR47-like protein [Leptospira interrogans str. 2002000626]EMY26919.1 FR47-like protein [Leptospira interrogans serovar Australis str. 200703203]AKH79030.1 acetyltransferase [Leptospira interrogans serovar Bratislava]